MPGKADPPHRPVEEFSSSLFPIVGVGAAWGGIDALATFFAKATPGLGIAYVVVWHTETELGSDPAEALRRVTDLPVTIVSSATRVEPDHIYVVAPGTTLILVAGELAPARPMDRAGDESAIDVLFASLAQDRAGHAAGVLLSGTGSAGTLGLRAIRDKGGLTLVEAGTEHDGMMRAALATGLVDFLLPVADLPAKLADFFSHAPSWDPLKQSDAFSPDSIEGFSHLCAVLRARTGHDFSGYKDKTIQRRVQRRMQILQIAQLGDFLDRLRADPREVDLLFQDLLIGVTSFFRDPAVFEALERDVIPRMFQGKGADDTVRVWVAGCATGEEAYSIALLLRAFMPKSYAAPKLQVFASDIDEHALEVARTGRYPGTIAKDVPARFLDRYFLHEDGTYRVGPDIREICIFANHDALRDAPFSKLDLVSCRNLLIYLGSAMQQRLIALFHYALRDSGFLLLGTSENVTRQMRLFSVVDKESRIFRRRPQATRQLPDFLAAMPDPTSRRGGASGALISDGSLRDKAERLLLERYTPAYVVINGNGDIYYASARTGKYLELPAGPPTSNIFQLARRGLKLDLRAAVLKAIEQDQAVVQNNVTVGFNGGRQLINLFVQRMRIETGDEPLCMIVFQDVGPVVPDRDYVEPPVDEELAGATIRQLEAEVRATRERLQTTTEELESSNEELKSSNEELSSMNEELQSANEELETSKEELQSINEELQTLNAELKGRVDELSRANSDIANLLESTQIATLFLDRDLSIKSFTPAAKDVFHLVESDAGRPLSHVRSRLRLDTVQADAERVLRTLGTIEERVDSEDGTKRYIMRVLPYRTIDNLIAGVVISFIDVTRITTAEREIARLTRALRDRVESLEILFDLVPVGILVSSNDTSQHDQVNRVGARLLGDLDEQSGPRPVAVPYRLFDAGRELPFWDQPLQKAALTGRSVAATELRLVRSDDSAIDVIMQAEPRFDEHGGACGAIASFVDITDRKTAEAHLGSLLHALQYRVKDILAYVSSLATRMLASTASFDGFATAFAARLAALGRLHEFLSQDEFEGADLGDLAMSIIAPFAEQADEQISLVGRRVVLSPRQATASGMAFHELATNAALYGALSAPNGRVTLAWEIVTAPDGKRLSATWSERNGPAIEAAPEPGFGIRFIHHCIESELRGAVRSNFDRDGLTCNIEFSLSDD